MSAFSSRRTFLDQVRSHGAQRRQLSTDQCQLGLHQALMLIQLIGHLLQLIGQGFFGIAVDRYRQARRQAIGDLIETVGQALRRAIDQLFLDLGR